jgi:hypothetical protein
MLIRDAEKEGRCVTHAQLSTGTPPDVLAVIVWQVSWLMGLHQWIVFPGKIPVTL